MPVKLPFFGESVTARRMAPISAFPHGRSAAVSRSTSMTFNNQIAGAFAAAAISRCRAIGAHLERSST